jgi:TPP-dependent pyruvate/acetoin dehydrogenase alpha subunit
VANETDLNEIDQKITNVMEESAQQALDAPFPDVAVAQEDVYA